jgi:hypothetical protein
MMLIVNGEPPTVDAHVSASVGFRAFLAAALVKAPQQRPSARVLLLAPFVSGATVDSLRELVESQACGADRRGSAQPPTPTASTALSRNAPASIEKTILL